MIAAGDPRAKVVACCRSVPAEPAVAAIATSQPGLVVVRRDQTVALYPPGGTSARRLAALHGERITEIPEAGTRTAAIVERDGHIGVRVLELAPRLQWGVYIARTRTAARSRSLPVTIGWRCSRELAGRACASS